MIWGNDKSSFEKFGSNCLQYVWRRSGEWYNKDCLSQFVKHGGAAVMIRGFMSSSGVGGLFFFSELINSELCNTALKVSDWLQLHFSVWQPSQIYCQSSRNIPEQKNTEYTISHGLASSNPSCNRVRGRVHQNVKSKQEPTNSHTRIVIFSNTRTTMKTDYQTHGWITPNFLPQLHQISVTTEWRWCSVKLCIGSNKLYTCVSVKIVVCLK